MVLNNDILSFFVTFAVSLNVDIIENSFNFINIQSKMTIDQFSFAGKKAIVRVDFNVPLDENGNVTDDTRIRGALPTLKKILADGGAVIMMSHMVSLRVRLIQSSLSLRLLLRFLSALV